ncbi:hypothetical protein CNMCM5878_009240 [Aspergillus fumigatiaffinis]|nr:hypothetical protein CNMCM5878_009240 [Aspergillus fumigatiaffinis]
MSKRAADASEEHSAALKAGERPVADDIPDEVGEFEDEFEDEFESEDEILEAGVDGRPDAEREEEEKDAMEVDKQTFIPGRTKLAPGEVLSPDPSTYDMLHTLSTPWPCLSFDIVRDSLGDNRKTYPATVYAVSGTQAAGGRAKENELLVIKMSGLSKMEKENETDSESDSDSDDDSDEPILESKSIPLGSTTNRIRAHQTPSQSADYSRPPQTITATMLENSHVVIHDVTPHLTSFDVPGTVLPPSASKPLSTLRMHKSEGYALDWSPLQPLGKLLTGDNDGLIYVTTRTEGGGWVTDTRPFTGHTSSVEELQWSPNERNVFASASSDGSVKVWDVRSKSRKPAVDVKVSNTDVNVMSWSKQTFHLLATGADDGQWAVWDLRHWKPNASAPSSQIKASPVAAFDFHREPVTSIEWHPTDDSVVAVGSADNTVTLWDLAVELDEEESREAGLAEVPPQLLFVHYTESVKEIHWQAQMPGTIMATGSSGFGTVHHVYQKSHGTASKFDLVWDPHQTWVKTPASLTFVLESADDSAEWETDAPQDSHDEAPPSEQIPPTPRAVFPDISSLLIPDPTRSYDAVVGNHQLDVPVPTPSIPDETQLILPSSTAISPTTDICDSRSHFSTEVPRRALEVPMVLKAVLALAARHDAILSDASDWEAAEYHGQCLELLIAALAQPEDTYDDNLLITVVILRIYEELESNNDEKYHLFGSNRLLNTMSRSAYSGGLAEAVSWQFLRQAIYASVVQYQPMQLDLENYERSAVFHRRDDAAYANIIIYLCARILQCGGAYTRGMDEETWRQLSDSVEQWHRGKPISWQPLKYKPANIAESRPFPEIWMMSPPAVVGMQYYHTSCIFLTLSNRHWQAASDFELARLQRIVENTIASHLNMVIGLSMSNETVENAYFMACHLLHRYGYCLRHPLEQRGSLRFLAHVEKTVGWRTRWMIRELEKQWSELRGLDTWGESAS